MTPFLISIPKSGTHIIKQATYRRGSNVPYGSMIYEYDPHKLALEGIQTASKIGISHLPYHPAYERELYRKQAKVVFLYRDPRDLMVSYYFWIKKLGHSGNSIPGLIDDVTPILESDDPFTLMMQFWGTHIRRYISWLFVPEILSIQYESLVQSAESTFYVLEQFWNGAFGTSKEMMRRIKPHKCETFRKGIVGDWRNHFSPKHHKLFMENLGKEMEYMGYA